MFLSTIWKRRMMKEELVRLARAEALNPIQLRLWSYRDPSANICRNQNREKALDRNGMVVIQSVRNQEWYVGFLQEISIKGVVRVWVSRRYFPTCSPRSWEPEI